MIEDTNYFSEEQLIKNIHKAKVWVLVRIEGMEMHVDSSAPEEIPDVLGCMFAQDEEMYKELKRRVKEHKAYNNKNVN